MSAPRSMKRGRIWWFYAHTLPQAYYAVRYWRERREMRRRVYASFAAVGIDYKREVQDKQ